jgi:hypothetical protein
MMGETVVRFLVGGALVASFALLGDLFTPKSFAGLFAGAPSVALATIALTLHTEGSGYARLEARSMVLGAGAFLVYAASLSTILHGRKFRPTPTALGLLTVWFTLAAGGFALALR